jgi:Arc/MetJ-type ribon-helix-helix transcriptional regulator
MTVELDRDVQDFLDQQVRSGVCADARELVNDVLRSIRDQQNVSLEPTPELEEWLLEAANQPTTPLTADDFDALEKRVLARHKSHRP